MALIGVGMVFTDNRFYRANVRLTDLVSRFHDYMDEALQGLDHCDLRIFMAPEFYFAKTTANTFFSEQEKQAIIDGIEERLTNERILVIAGTVLWSQYRFCQSNLVYNTALAFYRGQLVYQHNKTLWGGETRDGDLIARNSAPLQQKVVVGEKRFLGIGPKLSSKYKYLIGGTPGFFTLPNELTDEPAQLRIGLEVCMEHDHGVLRQSGEEDVWLHLVTANTVTYKQGNQHINETGVFLRCAAGEDGSGGHTIGRYLSGFKDVTQHALDARLRPGAFNGHLQPSVNGNRPVKIARFTLNASPS